MRFASKMVMRTLTIKNVPDEVYESLVDRAKNNRRSLNNEALIRLENTLMELQDADDLLAQVDRFRETLPKSLWVIDADLRESRKELEGRTERFVQKHPLGPKKGVRVK